MARKKKQKHSLAFWLLIGFWYYPIIGICKFLFEALFSKKAKRQRARLEKHNRDFFNKR
ncbi:MAG: hypothetical protein K2H29_02905 [Oscillospiraceae bacterium]|nr:hypothetical protein [Oscillospiraceae bacterium]